MSKKITFIGAGSINFTRDLVRDLLTFDAFRDLEISLMDIDDERLEFARAGVQRIIDAGNYPATVTCTKDRKKALEGADGVTTTILQGGPQVFRTDIEIPKKYGVDINVGDTRGPSGIFRALRTIPQMLDIAKSVEEVCPKAIWLNYTNPMAMLCSAVQKVYPKLSCTGLCHSVQGTAGMLASWIGAPMNEVTYFCAGINHQAHYLRFEWNGEDAYPLIHKAITERPEIYNAEQVRNEMYLALGYYVTESSGHNSEYCAWFRKRPDLIEKYCTHGTDWNPGAYAYILKEYLDRDTNWRQIVADSMKGEVNLKRGGEYASNIFNAIFGDNTTYEFNGNLPNTGIITNLPNECCVEVPTFATRRGLTPAYVGELPAAVAVLNNTSARCEELAVHGAIEGDPVKIFQAVLFDPLTSAVLSIEEIRNMVNEMLAANKDYLGHFSSLEVKR